MPATDPSTDLHVTRLGPVLEIRFDRPKRKNALTQEMYRLAAEALAEAESDPAVRAVLFSGAGGVFTSGNDLQDFAQSPPTSPDTPVLRFLQALVGAGKPLVAAVEGPAVGIGTTMLLHCDLVYAAPSARFRLPFVNLGLCPEGASSLLLPRMMGHARAAELLLLGEAFSATHAHEVGIVTAVVEDDVLAHARARVQELAALAPAAVRATKALMKRADAGAVEEALHGEAEVFLARLRSPEAAEAFKAFFERRAPDFSTFS